MNKQAPVKSKPTKRVTYAFVALFVVFIAVLSIFPYLGFLLLLALVAAALLYGSTRDFRCRVQNTLGCGQAGDDNNSDSSG